MEDNHWFMNRSESVIEAISREVREEVGLELDTNRSPVHLVGRHTKNGRFGAMNDNYNCYAVFTKQTDNVAIDRDELDEASWVSVSTLLKKIRKCGNHPSLNQVKTFFRNAYH